MEVDRRPSATPTLPKPVEQIRADFPLLAREVNGKPLVYLDSGATSQKPASVIEAIDSYYRHSNANIHRAVYDLGEESTALYEGAKQRVADFIGGAVRRDDLHPQRDRGDQPRPLHLGPSRTCGAGDVVLITEMEHHSNIVPWQLLCQEQGARLEYLSRRRRRQARPRRAGREARRRQRQAGRRHARLERARDDQPGRRDRAPRARGGREGARRRRPGRSADAGRRRARSAPTSTASPATRCSARTGSASCGRGVSCSRRCRRSSAAAT